MLQTIKANPASNTQRISDELSISQCGLSSSQLWQKHPEMRNCASFYQNIAKLLTRPSIWVLGSHFRIFIKILLHKKQT